MNIIIIYKVNIIKLDAIDSTSRFLKDLSKSKCLENFTTVVADAQTAGKGQRNTQWYSEPGENLLFTFFVDLQGVDVSLAPSLSFLVAIKLRELLNDFMLGDGKVQIKWPNDIMSYHKKIAGILIENTVKNQKLSTSFIGIGLNVNQLSFPEDLFQATSMSKVTGKTYCKELLLQEIITRFKEVLTKEYLIENKENIKKQYLNYLYKMQLPAMYKDNLGTVFMGKIVNVSNLGQLVIEKEDGKLYNFDLKEVKFLL